MGIFNYEEFHGLINHYSALAEEPIESLKSGRHKQILDHITRLNQYDEFYILYSIKEKRAIWHYGLDSCLGYKSTDSYFDFFEFLTTMLHPFMREWVLAFIAGMYKFSFAKPISESINTRYVMNLPIRNVNKSYVLVKQICMPFQSDKNGVIVSYLNKFIIVDKYKVEPLKPRLFNREVRMKELEKSIKQEAANFLIIPSKNLPSEHLMTSAKIFKEATHHSSDILTKVTSLKISKKRKQEEKLSIDGINKNRLRLKEKIVPLLNVPDDKESLKWVPNFNDTYTLIDFVIESGIAEALTYYREQKLFLKS